MKLTEQQVNHLNRLSAACENAENFNQSYIRYGRLDDYMDHLMEQGIDCNDIISAIN